MPKSSTSKFKDLISRFLKQRPKEIIDVSEIKKYVMEVTPEDFTEGVFAGAMDALMKDENTFIFRVRRGKYQYDPDSQSDDITPKVIEILEKTIDQIEKAVSSINIFQLEADDLVKIRKFKNIIEQLAEIKEDLNSD